MNEGKELIINNEEYSLIKNYKDNDQYRRAFCKLSMKIFGLDFEDWYQDGYWGDRYIPYSILHRDKLVANISVNTIDFSIEGRLFPLVQIGTVMTDEEYRNKGLSRILMNQILKDYEDQCVLFYLYANDTVLDFYPKFGFTEAKEYIYTKEFIKENHILSKRKLDLKNRKDLEIVTRLAVNTIPTSKIAMVGNMGLDMFYLNKFMYEDIYYIEELDLAAVADYDGDQMYLIDIFSEKPFSLDKVISALLTKEKMKVALGFTPIEAASFRCEEWKEDNLTFFIRGNNIIEKGRFPLLSHA